MKTYELFTGVDLEIAELIQQRRYQLLIHSCIYYHLNASVITDQKWTEWAKELCNLQSLYPQISERVDLYEYFADWDASTGMQLPITLDWVVGTAEKILASANHTKVKVVKKPDKGKKRILF